MNILKSFSKISKKGAVFIMIFSIILSTFPFTQQKTEAIGLENIASGVLSCTAGAFIASGIDELKNWGLGMIGLGGIFGGGEVPTKDGVVRDKTAQEAAKDCFMDGLANAIKRELVNAMVKETIDWANGGSGGDSRYGRIADKILDRAKNEVLDTVLYEQGGWLRGLCTGFEIPIKFALQKEFYSKGKESENIEYKPKCTLAEFKVTTEIVEGEPATYSWDKFLAITTNPDNNAFGVFFNTVNSVKSRVGETERNLSNEKNRNKGFLSYRVCSQVYIDARKSQGKSGKYDASPFAQKHCKITTAGTQISTMLDKALGTEGEALIAADEFDEILSEFITSFVNSLIHGDGKGVAGMSESEYYGDITDPNADHFGRYIEESVGPESYEKAISIAEARKQTIERVLSIYNEARTCWSNKKEDLRKIEEEIQARIDNPRLIIKEDGEIKNPVKLLIKTTIDNRGDITNVKLTNLTVFTALQKIDKEISEIQEELNAVSIHLQELRDDKGKAATVSEEVANAKSISKKMAIIKRVGAEPADIPQEREEKNRVDILLNRMVNGKAVGYEDGGEKKVGGVLSLKKYCNGFVRKVVPGSTTPSINDLESLPATQQINIVIE